MRGRGVLIALLLVALAMLSVSCGRRGLSAADYQELVLKTLQEEGTGEAPSLPGLITTLDQLFTSLECAETSCQSPHEFSEIGDAAELVETIVADREGKICRKEVHPPRQLEEVHHRICSSLDELRKITDAMKITARLAADLLSQSYGDRSSFAEVSQRYSFRINKQEKEIFEILRRLQDIPWLSPLFEGII